MFLHLLEMDRHVVVDFIQMRKSMLNCLKFLFAGLSACTVSNFLSAEAGFDILKPNQILILFPVIYQQVFLKLFITVAPEGFSIHACSTFNNLNSSKMKYLCLILLIPFIYFSPLKAQSNEDSSPTLGIGASVQSSQSDINLPIWLSDNVILSPSLSVLYSEGNGTDLGLGILMKFYFQGTTEEVRPYVGARLGVLVFNPDSDADGSTDLLAGPALGADYFIHSNVSIGAEAQLNIGAAGENSSRFGSQNGITVNTAAALTMNIYF